MENKLVILSFPHKSKHFVLRTADNDVNITLVLDEIIVNASLHNISDSYEDALQYVKANS